jgi:aryl-alcohol dehydrogenase-like predicted oxidoreductase
VSLRVPTTELGTTGLAASRIGLGLAAIGRPAYIDAGRSVDLGEDRSSDALERRSHEVLDTAFGHGVRYVDVARSYGSAEAFLASWLRSRGLAPSDVTVGSKWGYTYVGGWRLDAEIHERKDHSVGAFRRQLAESRDVLGPWLRLYQVHSVTIDSGVLEDRALLAGLAALRADGLVAGLTVSGPHQGDAVWRALDVEVAGRNPFECVQATWNLYERSATMALEAAHRAGWGVILKEVLANGRLTERGRDPRLDRVRRIAGRHGVGVDALALGIAASRPWVDVALSGAATPGQVLSNLDALRVQVSDEEMEELGFMREEPERYWAERAALPWR